MRVISALDVKSKNGYLFLKKSSMQAENTSEVKIEEIDSPLIKKVKINDYLNSK